MNLPFYIQPSNLNTSNAELYLTIDAPGLSYIILEGGTCKALAIYLFKPGTSNELVAGLMHRVIAEQPVLKQKFKKVNIIYGYAPSILIPQQFMHEKDNGALLDLIYGDSGERINRYDFMYRQAIQNVYGVPAVIEQVITRYFSSAYYNHIYSLMANVVKYPGNHLYCIFSEGQLKALLVKDSKLQMMQHFDYKTPEDVVFHLLKLCKSFDVNVNDTILQLSGLIEADSALYIELCKYFLQVQFDTLTDIYQYPEEIFQHPAHYFSHLFSLAACV